MSELSDLYQEVILDHNRKPRNFGSLEEPVRRAEGFNPLCGDRVTVYLDLEGDRVRDIRFEGSGCAISTASASVMTETVKGKSMSEVDDLFRRFLDLVRGTTPGGAELGKLRVFSGVCEFPVRVKCASLAWHTLQAALKNEPGQGVTTE